MVTPVLATWRAIPRPTPHQDPPGKRAGRAHRIHGEADAQSCANFRLPIWGWSHVVPVVGFGLAFRLGVCALFLGAA